MKPILKIKLANKKIHLYFNYLYLKIIFKALFQQPILLQLDFLFTIPISICLLYQQYNLFLILLRFCARCK
jgi:hypothetical protein